MNTTFDVFLSYVSHDKSAARKIAEALAAHGLKVWFDEWNIVPGRPWQDLLEEAIANSNAAVIIIGETGLGPWQQREMQACLAYAVSERRPVIPVYAPSAAHTELPVFLRQFTAIQIKSWSDNDLEEALRKIVWGVTGRLAAPLAKTPIPKVFLCHAKEDDQKIRNLYFRLRDFDIDPWYDKEKLTVGDRWEQEIIRAIETTDFFAICLSPRSIKKTGFIQREIKVAVREYQRRPQQLPFLLPVRLEPCDVPSIKLDEVTTLSAFQWIDLFEEEEESLRLFAEGVRNQYEKVKQEGT